jgi:signal recognition particle GTPase
MSNAEAKKAYETYMQELSKEQVAKTKQHVQAQEEEKSEAIASRWTENDLDTKLTTAYTTVFTEVYPREEFTALLKEAGEEIKQLITTNSLALPTTKSAIQEILHKKVEEKMQTPEKTARIQQRIQEEVEKIQLTIQHPTTQNELTQKNPTNLPLRLRGTTGPGTTNATTYTAQSIISSTDSRSSSLPA